MKLTCTWFFAIFVLILSTATPALSSEGTDNFNDNWEKLVHKAEGQTVHMYMLVGNNGANRYIDQWVSPRLNDKYNIILKRVPVTDIREIINKLLTEKQFGKEKGKTDIIWINGENFNLAMQNDLLEGPFANRLPSFQKYVDENAEDIKLDFARPVKGYEAPWGKAQFVMIYDSKHVKDPPGSIADLGEWVRDNPGRFTYPAPPDFTGSCFVRHAVLEYSKQFNNTPSQLEKGKTLTWEYFSSIEPYLWRKGSTYPRGIGILDQLYANGEVWMTMNYNPLHCFNQVKSGFFPKTSRTFIFDYGTFSNTHYLGIPFNSESKEGAMVTINFLLSPEAQIEKFKPEVWGDGMAIDTSKLEPEFQKILQNTVVEPWSLPFDILENNRIPEFSSEEIEIIEDEWMENVGKK